MHEAMIRREKPNWWKKGTTKMIKCSKKKKIIDIV